MWCRSNPAQHRTGSCPLQVRQCVHENCPRKRTGEALRFLGERRLAMFRRGRPIELVDRALMSHEPSIVTHRRHLVQNDWKVLMESRPDQRSSWARGGTSRVVSSDRPSLDGAALGTEAPRLEQAIRVL